jgi:hypothetical protein
MAAINRKIEQLYIAQEYEFRVVREGRESERKRIEAAGIRDFQRIVSEGISESYLRWRGIEATLQLAQSNNAKTVIIGSNKDGLPIILGNADAPPPPLPPSGGGTSPTRTAPQPPTSSETAPSTGLTEPPEKIPSVYPGPSSSATPQKPVSFLPRNLSEAGAMLFRTPAFAGPTAPHPNQAPVEQHQ